MNDKKSVACYRVIYGDCDSMAIVYYSNYLRLFEIGRTEWLRDQGIAYREVERKGFFLPATEAYLKYAQPAAYDDLLTIETRVGFVTELWRVIPYMRVWIEITGSFGFRIFCSRYSKESE
jgi:YbgC/YbaW family acyl-CoA thioester hydrolase